MFSQCAVSAGPEMSLTMHEFSQFKALSVLIYHSVLSKYVLCTYHIPGPLLGSGYVAVNKTRDPHGAYCLISKADTGQVIKNINLMQCLVP